MTETEKNALEAFDFKTLRDTLRSAPRPALCLRNVLYARGVMRDPNAPSPTVRANMFKALLDGAGKYIPAGELIAGSTVGLYGECDAGECENADELMRSFVFRGFRTNADHFAPNYARILSDGIPGTLEKLEASLYSYHADGEKIVFLNAMKTALVAFRDFVRGYADSAYAQGRDDIGDVCAALCCHAPRSFREGLQLVMLVHTAFLHEGRYAMALGRLDQYLFPLFDRDISAGRLTYNDAVRLLMAAFLKLENDVANIAIAGVKRDGSDATNALTYAVLEAVGRCNIPGPNLSARLHDDIPERFLDEALKVIGTGLGYPALMNDGVNIPALHRHGYTLEDSRDYCMVGCIENFIQGRQPPWSDGRFNTPKYLEYALRNGCDMRTGKRVGPETGAPETLDTMEKLMAALEEQLRYGASLYVLRFNNMNAQLNPKTHTQPFLSLFCDDCIGRGRDINDGGALYPSVHGACGMGIATVADSLAAIEKVVYRDRAATLREVSDALAANFEGYAELRAKLAAAPKYGNGDDFVDKYAVWFVKFQDELFAPYRTRDGGAFYTAIASNVSNIPAGTEVAATPDGRGAGEPLSDAASPAQGRDRNGPTAAALSLSKPDYSLVSCGTVVNQKYSPEMFRDPEKRARLAAMIRAYFKMGGQELQINSVSRETLTDAMEHPAGYESLVVRVSGFSAYYTGLTKAVQQDILRRTEHE